VWPGQNRTVAGLLQELATDEVVERLDPPQAGWRQPGRKRVA
jgi:hypothetical protein